MNSEMLNKNNMAKPAKNYQRILFAFKFGKLVEINEAEKSKIDQQRIEFMNQLKSLNDKIPGIIY